MHPQMGLPKKITILKRKKMIISEHPQGTADWFADRRKKATASNFHIIMSSAYGLTEIQAAKLQKMSDQYCDYEDGVDKVKPLTAAQTKEYDKLFHKLEHPWGAGAHSYAKEIASHWIIHNFEEQFQSQDMQDGQFLEPFAAQEYEKKYFKQTAEVGFITSTGNPFIGGSPDRLLINQDDTPGVQLPKYAGGLEIKCPKAKKHVDNLLAEVCPPEYMDQIQGCMMITESKFWDFVSYNPDFEEDQQIKVIRVEPDPKWVETFNSRITGFEELVRSYVMTLAGV
jgi:hypothetical protein